MRQPAELNTVRGARYAACSISRFLNLSVNINQSTENSPCAPRPLNLSFPIPIDISLFREIFAIKVASLT